MAREDQTSPQPGAGDEEKQASPAIEMRDSRSGCEGEEGRPDPARMEERTFVSSLRSFMKDRGRPIERIPHLGFKQINLWRIYKAVEELGGYESVTERRLWKKVYDELGGSPGSTSAATCTRRHYEKLVLLFERHVRGEDDRPLPPCKPQMHYKRNAVGKVLKEERKRKRIESEREMDSQRPTQRSPEAAMHPQPAPWAMTSLRKHPDWPQTNASVQARLVPVPVPASSRWTAHIPPAAGEVISPLEKKKRMAQASLGEAPGPPREAKGRPSVIRLSPRRGVNSSDGSPAPLSSPSSSSRSPSPYSLSSEDGAAGHEDGPASGSGKNSEEDVGSVSCSQTSVGRSEDVSHAGSRSADWLRDLQVQSARHSPHPLHSSSSFAVDYGWAPSSTSSFTKVVPKAALPLRPAPIRPGFKARQGSWADRGDSLTCVRRPSDTTPWPVHRTERREKPGTTLERGPTSPQTLPRPAAGLPVSSCVPSSYEKCGRVARHHPPSHPAFLPTRVRLPQSQLVYRHFPAGPAHSALIGSAGYPYPYAIPLPIPQTGYTLSAMNPTYPHKL